jgi:hypothetical protein
MNLILSCGVLVGVASLMALAPAGAADQPTKQEKPGKGASASKSGKSAKAAKSGKATKTGAAGGYAKELSLQGIGFKVSCPNKGSINQVTVVPSGLSGKNEAVVAEVDGCVMGAEVDDLNGDGSPEIYVFTQSAGSGSYGSVIAYAANKKKSLSQVTFPDLGDNAKASVGYTGHDEFAVVENRLVRRFKVDGGGATRQIQYRLDAGEAGWILRVDRVSQF